MNNEGHLRFLRAVRDKEDVMGILRKYDIGYGWAIEEGFVSKHPACLEFRLTTKGREYLAERQP